MNKNIFVLDKKAKDIISKLIDYPDKYFTVRKDIELLCTWHLFYRQTLPSSYARVVVWDSGGYCYVNFEEADIKHKDFRAIIANSIKEITNSCLGILRD